MLMGTWGSMLVDASPFDTPTDGLALGLEQLIALSLIARALPGRLQQPHPLLVQHRDVRRAVHLLLAQPRASVGEPPLAERARAGTSLPLQ